MQVITKTGQQVFVFSDYEVGLLASAVAHASVHYKDLDEEVRETHPNGDFYKVGAKLLRIIDKKPEYEGDKK